MKIISHRGLVEGPDKAKENSINEIEKNIKCFPGVLYEIDIWIIENKIYLGHEIGKTFIEINHLLSLKDNLILHIKGLKHNFQTMLNKIRDNNCHYFCHDLDDFTITSLGWLWVHPNAGFIKESICVMPEKIISIKNFKVLKEKSLLGVCTDYPIKILEIFK